MPLTSRTYSIPSSTPLSVVAESLVEYNFSGDEAVHFVPEARFEILFQDDAMFWTSAIGSEEWRSRPSGFLGGLHTRAYLVRPEKPARCYGIRFKAQSAALVVRDSLQAFRNGIVDVEQVYGSEGRILVDQLSELNSNKEKFDRLISFFERHISEDRLRLPGSLEQMISDDTSISVGGMAKHANTSVSNFRKLFGREMGLSPKEFIRVIRVQKAIRYLRDRADMSLTQIGYALGYFDQSHFVRDFRGVAGYTPGKHRVLNQAQLAGPHPT